MMMRSAYHLATKRQQRKFHQFQMLTAKGNSNNRYKKDGCKKQVNQ
jgi:hypothetical protein